MNDDLDVRLYLDEAFVAWHDDDIDDALGEDLVDALENLQELSFDLKQIGRALGKALPGAIQGAVTGATVGGIPGAIVGGIAGGAGSMTGGSRATPTVTAAATTSTASSQAAAQLLYVLLRPEVIQALAAMSLGNRGASTVRVGNTVVPVAAIGTMLQRLIAQAAPDDYVEGVGPEMFATEDEDDVEYVLQPGSSEYDADDLADLIDSYDHGGY